jgi:hypothetical protein
LRTRARCGTWLSAAIRWQQDRGRRRPTSARYHRRESRGRAIAPFFRASATALAPDVLAYLQERGASLWSYDIASGDNEPDVTATQLANRTLAKIRAMGRGVIQFHETRKVAVDALDTILSGARHSGFKVGANRAGDEFYAGRCLPIGHSLAPQSPPQNWQKPPLPMMLGPAIGRRTAERPVLGLCTCPRVRRSRQSMDASCC